MSNSRSCAEPRLTCRLTKLLFFLAMPMHLFGLLLGAAIWLSVFLLVPTLLICVWTALQPYRLWLFLKSRMIGPHFLL